MCSMHGKKSFMAIKIDLEKAYDRLNQEFVIDCLRNVGLHDHIINLIWHCISSSSLDISWNGVSTGEFSPSTGIRQTDPLSPYLFVISME